MATAAQALRKMRDICLDLPGVREGDHFGKSAFYVGGRLFATCGEEDGAYAITVGLEPAHAAALVARDPRFQPYPRDRRGVILPASKVKGWAEVRALVLESYGLMKTPKRPRRTSPGARKRNRE